MSDTGITRLACIIISFCVFIGWCRQAEAATFPPEMVYVCIYSRLDDGSRECYDTLFAIKSIEICGSLRPITAYDGGEGNMTITFDGVGDPIMFAYSDRSYQSNTPGNGDATLNVIATTEFSDSAERCRVWVR